MLAKSGVRKLSTHLRLEPFLESQAGHLRKREDKASMSMSSRRTRGLHLLKGDLPLPLPNLILGGCLSKAIQPNVRQRAQLVWTDSRRTSKCV